MFQYINYVLALFDCGQLTENELSICLNYSQEQLMVGKYRL